MRIKIFTFMFLFLMSSSVCAVADVSADGHVRSDIEELKEVDADLQSQITAIEDPRSLIVPFFMGECSLDNSNAKPGEHVKFCLDKVKFNSAQNYLSVNKSGVVTVLVQGFYRLSTDIIGKEFLFVNGQQDMDSIYMKPFWAGDTFHYELLSPESRKCESVSISYVGAHNFVNPHN